MNEMDRLQQRIYNIHLFIISNYMCQGIDDINLASGLDLYFGK